MRSPESDETFFQVRMHRIRDGQRTRIPENSRSFFETDAMLAPIGSMELMGTATWPVKPQGYAVERGGSC